MYDLQHSKVEIFAASLWLAYCSIIFLSSTIHLKGKENDEEEEIDHETQGGISEMPDGNLGLTCESELEKRTSRKKNREQFKGSLSLWVEDSGGW